MVVSYRNSTSNHNDFRIFAQQGIVVSYRNSTSNHNSESVIRSATPVVSYRNSTSNHNTRMCPADSGPVVSYRNSTSNHNPTVGVMSLRSLYLIEILHQTTTAAWDEAKREQLYLIEILHQTTTFDFRPRFSPGCILSKFYIKPQQCPSPVEISTVVSYRNSTSNHNSFVTITAIRRLYLIEILHQTTTTTLSRCPAFRLYLIEILHQTTTVATDGTLTGGCILSKFYIKPQRCLRFFWPRTCCILSKFYIKPQPVALLLTTSSSCILSKFYIKPQLRR